MKKAIVLAAAIVAAQPIYARSLSANKWDCDKISGVTTAYEGELSKRLQVSRRQIDFTGTEINSFGNCVVILDALNIGEIRCTVHSIYQNGDEYLADGTRIDSCDR